MVSYGRLIPLCAASILRGCEPTGNVSGPGMQTVPSASHDEYQAAADKLTEESSSNGNPKTSSDKNTVSAIRTCDQSNTKCKKKRTAVPLEKKDDKYWEKRRRNNLAAKRCRESKRHKQFRELQIADKSMQENRRLRVEVSACRLELATLRRILREANTTLALLVQARQAMAPSNKLPAQAVFNCTSQ